MEQSKKEKEPPVGGADHPAASRYEEVLMREAHELINKKKYEAACGVLQDILGRAGVSLDDNQKSLLHSELGTVYFWLADYEAAQFNCQKALWHASNNDQAYSILGIIAVARFQFPQARSYFSKISSDNPARSLGMCLISIKLRDAKGAAAFLKEVLGKMQSSDPEFSVYRAYLQLLKGDPKNALREAESLLPKCDKDPFLTLLIAEIFMTAGNYGAASAASNKVLIHCPNNDYAFAVLAHAAYAEENFSEADNYAREAVRLNSLNAYAKTVLMKLAVRSGNYASAESIGAQIIHDCPEYSLGHANLGDVYFNQGRYELAQVEYEQTKQLMDADTKGARLRQARMKFINEDYAGAAALLEDLTEGRHTYYDDALCDLLLCYDKLGENEKKADLMEKMEFRRLFYHRTEQILRSFNT